MSDYKDLQDIKIKKIDNEFVEQQRKTTAKMMGAKECKLVCITLSFVGDNDVLSEYKLRGKDFDEKDWD